MKTIKQPPLGDICNTVESYEDLLALDKARNETKAVPMPPHIRQKIESIFNLPPVYNPQKGAKS